MQSDGHHAVGRKGLIVDIPPGFRPAMWLPASAFPPQPGMTPEVEQRLAIVRANVRAGLAPDAMEDECNA